MALLTACHEEAAVRDIGVLLDRQFAEERLDTTTDGTCGSGVAADPDPCVSTQVHPGITERVTLVGGRATCVSALGQGTTISITFDVEDRQRVH